MSVDRILALKLIGDVSSINKSMKQTQGRMRSFGASAGSWMKAAGIGLAIEGVGKLGDALGDAWTGFREGEKASAQLGTTWDNLNVKGANLDKTIGDIGDMALKLGTDDTEAIKAFNTALQMTGGKPAQAMNRLKIAQDLVANGSAPNLASAMKLIDRAASGSAATVRKFGLTSDTAGGRVKELGRKVKGAAKAAADADPIRVALNGIGEGLETVVGALSKGDIEGAFGGLVAIGDSLSKAWTDVFPAIDTAMTNLIGSESWGNLKAAAQGLLDAISDTVGKLGLVWEGLAPHVQNAARLIGPLLENFGVWAETAFGVVTGAIDAVIALLNGDFTGAWNAITGIVDTVVTGVQKAMGNVLMFLQGLLPGFAEIAGNIGTAIFQGIVSIVGGLADAVRGIFQGAVDQLRKVWNDLDFYIPEFVVPGIPRVVVPDPLGGSGFEVFAGTGPTRIWEGSGDLIPDLAKGGIIRHSPGGTLARIGEAGRDEAVIPLSRMGDMGGGTSYVINVNVAATADKVAIGKQIVEAIQQYERRSGKVWRTA